MKRTTLSSVLVIVCVMAVLGLTGCQTIAEKATEKAVEEATGVKVDKDGDEVTITGEDGTQITSSENGELPDGFPEDVPVYEGTITGSIKADEGFTVGVETPDSVADVFDWYVAEAKAEGWTSTAEVKYEDRGSLSAEKGDRVFQAIITSNGDASGSAISLVTGPK